MTTERKLIRKEVATIDIDGYFLKHVIKDLAELLVKYGDTAKVEKTSYTYSDDEYFAIFVSTLETDAEIKTRMASEETLRTQRETSERAQYEALKAKFGATP